MGSGALTIEEVVRLSRTLCAGSQIDIDMDMLPLQFTTKGFSGIETLVVWGTRYAHFSKEQDPGVPLNIFFQKELIEDGTILEEFYFNEFGMVKRVEEIEQDPVLDSSRGRDWYYARTIGRRWLEKQQIIVIGASMMMAVDF